MENEAVIFDIQRSSFVDGPGIRTTVFFKGCNLQCAWCHNPESQSGKIQMMIYKDKCTGCGKCKDVCPNDLKKCDLCGLCVNLCPNDARHICGRKYTADEVLKEIMKDKNFYDSSGGGVTFSGGECMLQIDFLYEILKLCKKNGIHTAVDTAGNVPWEYFEKILPYTDLFLYDLKCYSDDLHKEITGVSNKLIISNLKELSDKSTVHIRIPVIPSQNDGDEEMTKMADFIKSLNLTATPELLAYHRMGEHKYEALNRKFRKFEVPDNDLMENLKNKFR